MAAVPDGVSQGDGSVVGHSGGHRLALLGRLALLYLVRLLRWMRRRGPAATPRTDEAAIRGAWDAHRPPEP